MFPYYYCIFVLFQGLTRSTQSSNEIAAPVPSERVSPPKEVVKPIPPPPKEVVKQIPPPPVAPVPASQPKPVISAVNNMHYLVSISGNKYTTKEIAVINSNNDESYLVSITCKIRTRNFG